MDSSTPGLPVHHQLQEFTQTHVHRVSDVIPHEILKAWADFKGKPQELGLPSAPEQFITYFEEDNRPQAKLDRDIYNGMGVTVGRLREDTLFDYKFVGLSHNTVRGAAGGAVLCAELLKAQGYITHK